jgi:hypothetical protein
MAMENQGLFNPQKNQCQAVAGRGPRRAQHPHRRRTGLGRRHSIRALSAALGSARGQSHLRRTLKTPSPAWVARRTDRARQLIRDWNTLRFSLRDSEPASVVRHRCAFNTQPSSVFESRANSRCPVEGADRRTWIQGRHCLARQPQREDPFP